MLFPRFAGGVHVTFGSLPSLSRYLGATQTTRVSIWPISPDAGYRVITHGRDCRTYLLYLLTDQSPKANRVSFFLCLPSGIIRKSIGLA